MSDNPIPEWPDDDERPAIPPSVLPPSHGICWDADYLYVCDDFGVSSRPHWRRYPLATAPTWIREMFSRLTS